MDTGNVTHPDINNDTTLQAAKKYIQRGRSVVPAPCGSKGPVLDGWQHLRINAEQVGEFFTEESNIGLLLGEPSGGLADGDMDCDEAEHAAKP